MRSFYNLSEFKRKKGVAGWTWININQYLFFLFCMFYDVACVDHCDRKMLNSFSRH